LNRAKAASTIFYTVPGPKMLWQFGELGYDYSINYCEDNGTIDNACRTYPKPVEWDYRDDYNRYSLYTHVRDLLRLRDEYDVFTSGTATLLSTTELSKQLVLKNNPYTASPANADEMNAVVVVNFDVVSRNIFVDFPHTGTWYDYYGNGVEKLVNVNPASVQLPPGGYKIFTDVEIVSPLITGTEEELLSKVSVYPNPASDILRIESDEPIVELSIHTLHGVSYHPKRTSSDAWDIAELREGLYVAEIRTRKGISKIKLVKSNRVKN
jgi:hypothetical protein